MRVSFGEHKDANEALIKEGKEFILRKVSEATPWPVDGLYSASEYLDEVDQIFRDGLNAGKSTGYRDLDELYTINPGDLSIVTGHPSSGKSEFVDQLMTNLAEREGWRFAICSFENPPAYHICKFIQKNIRKPAFDGPTPKMSKAEKDIGANWVNDHFCFLHQSDGNLSDLDSIIERVKAAVLRYGIRGVVIDPYNYIFRPRDMNETEWISEMLSRVKALAMSYGLHIWFIAHPQKLMRKTDGSRPVPDGYDISGSAAWFAKADCGVTVQRKEYGPVEIHIWKIRWAWVGKNGQCELNYDPATTTYKDTALAPTITPQELSRQMAEIEYEKRRDPKKIH
jgi:twinkle protein